jgi:hypothetical protein
MYSMVIAPFLVFHSIRLCWVVWRAATRVLAQQIVGVSALLFGNATDYKFCCISKIIRTPINGLKAAFLKKMCFAAMRNYWN